MGRRTIACMTATRADYPRVKPVLREIARRPGLDLKLIVTGAHLSRAFGHTVDLIERDGFEIAQRVPMYAEDARGRGDSVYDMTKATARCMDGMADALRAIAPDLFLITVDRVETLAAAAGALMNLPLFHIQGGEVTGTIDESIRHAVTKLAHVHFPATPDAAERIVRMGEAPEHVHQVGCPYVDFIQSLRPLPKETLAQRYGFDPARPLAIFVQHPVTSEYGRGMGQIRATIEALGAFPGLEVFALFSNADAGGREMTDLMRWQAGFCVHPNLHETEFLSLMHHASVMVGNSSAGIREAPSFGLPVVNIGSRQQGRLRACNVIDVPHQSEAIAAALERALNDAAFRARAAACVNPYGDGHAASRIVDILEGQPLGPELTQKIIAY
ncbi:MAG: UDP-N-acetylglucosamine 2-epimerase [Candidatus Sedimenticola endophacoides]